jgi:hypothetical protein
VKSLSFSALKHPLPNIFLPLWKRGRSQKMQHLPKTVEQAMKQRHFEIALSDAIFVF